MKRLITFKERMTMPRFSKNNENGSDEIVSVVNVAIDVDSITSVMETMNGVEVVTSNGSEYPISVNDRTPSELFEMICDFMMTGTGDRILRIEDNMNSERSVYDMTDLGRRSFRTKIDEAAARLDELTNDLDDQMKSFK